jgi:hypothetical protein
MVEKGLSPHMQEFRIRWPKGDKPPPEWRTRLRAIETELNDPDSRLCAGLEEAKRLADLDGELAIFYRLEQVCREYPNLFPGEAGKRLLAAILSDTEPFLWERDRTQPARLPNGNPTPFHTYYARRNVFEQPSLEDPAPPRYHSQRKETGRKRAYAARSTPTHRRDIQVGLVKAGPEFETLRDMIEGDLHRRISPLTYPEAARKLRITTTELHKELYRLKNRIGLTWIRDAEKQADYAAWISKLIWAAEEAEKQKQPNDS